MQAEPPRKTFDGRFDVLSRWRFVEPQNETWTFAKLQPAKANEWRRCQKLWSQSSCHVRASVTTCRSCPFSYLYFISFSRLSPCGPKCPRAACSTITGLSRFLLFFLKRLGYRWYDMISVWLMRDVRFESTPQANQLSGTFRENDKFETSRNTCSSLA